MYRSICCGLLLVCLAALSLAGCQGPTIKPDVDATAKAGFDDFRRGDFAALNALLGPEIKETPDLDVKFAQLRANVPNQPPRGRKTIGWNLVEQPHGEETVDVSDEYDFGDRIVLWSTHLHKPSSGAPWLIEGLHLNSATIQQLAVNRFTLTDKAPLQYAFLLAAILSPVLMIAALIKVIRAKGLRRKWLWAIAAFAGVFSFQMNWATGRIFSNFLTVQLLDAGATRGASTFSAWVITMTLPLGAALILAGVWANPARARKRPAKAE